MRGRRLWTAGTIALVIAAAAAASVAVGGRLGIDGWLYDRGLAVRAALWPAPEGRDPGVAVVAVDPRSLDAPALARYPRAMFAPVWADLLDALAAAEARSVAFDFLLAFSAREINPAFDRPFLKALAENRERVVLGRSAGSLPAQSFLAALRFDPAALGLLELVPDADGVYRRIPAAYPTEDGQPLPTLAAAALDRAGAPPIAGAVLLAPRRHHEHIPAYALVDVLRCAADAPERLREHLAGRIVFVGTTLPEEDRKLGPGRFLPPPGQPEPPQGDDCALPDLGQTVPGARSVAGAFLHADAVRQVLRGEGMAMVAPAARHAAAGAAAGFGAAIGLALAPWLAVAAAVIGLIALFAGAVVLLEQGLWLPTAPAMTAIVASVFAAYLVRYFLEDRRRRRIQHAFGRYLAPSIVEGLLDDAAPLRLGGERTDITAMFADLSGFTALSTQVPAHELMEVTNGYLALIAEEVDASGGYVDKFIGDAVMAIWGAPLREPRHAERAVGAALAAAARIRAAGEASRTRGGGPVLGIKIGLHSGPAIVGNVGSDRRYNYTAVGETVNIASRLESLPGVYGCTVILGSTTAAAAGEAFLLREIDRVAVKGRDEPLDIYEAVCPCGEADEGTRRRLARYAEALALYRGRRFAEAAALWREPGAGDPPAVVMAERAETFAAHPPPGTWDGTWRMTGK